jgi:hypothetical protein
VVAQANGESVCADDVGSLHRCDATAFFLRRPPAYAREHEALPFFTTWANRHLMAKHSFLSSQQSFLIRSQYKNL